MIPNVSADLRFANITSVIFFQVLHSDQCFGLFFLFGCFEATKSVFRKTWLFRYFLEINFHWPFFRIFVALEVIYFD